MEDNILIYAVGFLAQILFFGRMFVQWFHSEKEGRPVSPTIFWKLSLMGSVLLFIYGVLRKDFAIVLGQMLVYFIYIRNLQLKERWKDMHIIFRVIFYIVPIICAGYLLSGAPNNLSDILNNEDVSTTLLIWGSAGQLIFTFRFVYQWIDSESRKESVLSPTFWIISLAGAVMIVSYAVFRLDPVLFLAQLLGSFIYSRNLLLGLNKKGLFTPYISKFVNKLTKEKAD
jgi:lipid-A-disaccharide synthase-like uncharacterized protein